MKRSPRELEHDLDRLKEQRGSEAEDVPEVGVEWRGAAPDTRPAGVEYDDTDGALRYDLWSAQRETLDVLESGEPDVVAFLAGYGSGKTIFGARWLIKQAIDYPGSRFLCMGVDFQKARDSTFRVLFEQLPGERTGIVTGSFNGPETSPLVADYNQQQNRVTLVNDSVIILGSSDRWDRYAGTEFGAIHLDEPSHYGPDLFDLLEMLGGRLRGVAGPKVQLWTLTGNGYNAAWEILERREDKNGDPIGLDIELVRASTLDNPYLDESDKERFTRQYADTARETQALHGGFAAATGLVYSTFSRDVHVVDREAIDDRLESGWRTYGYDAGWNDPRVALELARTNYGQLVALDEFYRDGTHVEDAIEWLAVHSKPVGPVFAEHEPSDIEKFRRAGYPATKAEKSLDAGIAEVRERFDVDDEDRPGLLVTEDCPNLIRELQGYKEEQVGRAAAVDHACDALRYAIMGEETAEGYHARRQARSNGETSSGVSYL